MVSSRTGYQYRGNSTGSRNPGYVTRGGRCAPIQALAPPQGPGPQGPGSQRKGLDGPGRQCHLAGGAAPCAKLSRGSGLRFRVWGFGVVQGAGCSVQGAARRLQGVGCRVQGAREQGPHSWWRICRALPDTKDPPRTSRLVGPRCRTYWRVHKRPYVGVSQVRSWSRWCGFGAILWAFIAKT